MGVVPTIDGIDVVVSAERREQSQLVKKIKTASICYYKAAGGGPTARTGETPLPGDLKITQNKAINFFTCNYLLNQIKLSFSKAPNRY